MGKTETGGRKTETERERQKLAGKTQSLMA